MNALDKHIHAGWRILSRDGNRINFQNINTGDTAYFIKCDCIGFSKLQAGENSIVKTPYRNIDSSINYAQNGVKYARRKGKWLTRAWGAIPDSISLMFKKI